MRTTVLLMPLTGSELEGGEVITVAPLPGLPGPAPSIIRLPILGALWQG